LRVARCCSIRRTVFGNRGQFGLSDPAWRLVPTYSTVMMWCSFFARRRCAPAVVVLVFAAEADPIPRLFRIGLHLALGGAGVVGQVTQQAVAGFVVECVFKY
jgi:hypothetical protein